MTVGAALFTIAVGAILAFAVQDAWSAVDIPTVGLILMVVGVIGLAFGVFQMFSARNAPGGPPR